jgi:hypothetical protein
MRGRLLRCKSRNGYVMWSLGRLASHACIEVDAKKPLMGQAAIYGVRSRYSADIRCRNTTAYSRPPHSDEVSRLKTS